MKSSVICYMQSCSVLLDIVIGHSKLILSSKMFDYFLFKEDGRTASPSKAFCGRSTGLLVLGAASKFANLETGNLLPLLFLLPLRHFQHHPILCADIASVPPPSTAVRVAIVDKSFVTISLMAPQTTVNDGW